ncbi:MAG: hypothetical protein K2O18_11965 [Oscillospiraceae bacterium]|nr:hypothetical protein [Oscillospiraceae bacterium]
MKKHIIFGGFDYAVRWEMDQDAIYRGIDYFVDNNSELIGTTYMGKLIYGPEKLLEEDRDNILILIGSIIYHTELEFQLMDMGFQEDIHYKWAVGFCGDEKCPRLWRHMEWNDQDANSNNLNCIENGEYALLRLRIVSRFINFEKIDTVVDVCAANGRIKEFLPENIRYIPVDYIPYSEETVLCDLRKNEFPNIVADFSRTCILLIGSIQYASDWRWLLRKISESCNCFICTHHDFVRLNREYRRTNFTNNNAVFNHQIILEMQKYGFMLTEAHDFQLRNVIMKFERAGKV